MATNQYTTPGAGYANSDIFTEAQLIAMGAKPASTDSATQTVAVSRLTPGVVVPGATNPNGTQVQAYTNPAPVAGPAPIIGDGTPPPAELYNLAGIGKPNNSITGTTDASGRATMNQLYNGTGLEGAYDAYGRMLQETQQPVDEAAIRDATMKRFQAQIDANNQYYAEVKRERLAKEAVNAAGRVGSNTAIQAKRGLIGSDFGTGQSDRINQYNDEVAGSIAQSVDAERNQMLQALLGQVRDASTKEYEDKVAARTKGAQDYIEFLKGAATRKEERANAAVANLVALGEEPDESTYKALAEQLGIDVASIKARFKTGVSEAAKNAPKPIEIGGVGYIRQADGTYKPVTPVAPEKPLILNGVAYEKQGDGSYKAVTPVEDSADFQFVAATKNQPQGYFNKKTGEFRAGNPPAASAGGASAPAPAAAKPAVPKASAAPAASKPAAPATAMTTAAQKKKEDADFLKVQRNIAQAGDILGTDGKIAPWDYEALKNAWIKAGNNPATFDTKMKGYRDPSNSYYGVGK